MNDITPYLTTLIVGFLLGFLQSYLSRKGENLATKEDIAEITSEIESVKNIFQDQYDLSKAERVFYDEMATDIYKFLAEIKKYEARNGTIATNSAISEDSDLKKKYYTFIDKANEFIGKSYVFLKEENYQNLEKAIDPNSSSNLADLTNNLLDAMRKSLHPDTTLTPKKNLKEFKYR